MEGMKNIKVYVVDDHPIMREGIINLLRSEKQIEITGEAGNVKDALEDILFIKPDIIILDIELGSEYGIDLCKELIKYNSHSKIIFLTMLKEKDLYEEALKYNIKGYLLKDHAREELLDAVKSVASGGNYFHLGLDSELTNKASSYVTNAKIINQISALSDTERDILKLIAQQCTTKQIADTLFVSDLTIKKHRHHIVTKLGLGNDQNSLLRFALEFKEFLK